MNDTSLLYKVKRQIDKYDDVNNVISKVVHWFNVNNLLLNGDKTKIIKFSTLNVRQVVTNVQLSGSKMQLIDFLVFLVVDLDKKLNWGQHIDNLANRLSSATLAVQKIR